LVEATRELPPLTTRAMPSPVLQLLRIATAAQHKTLEARLPLTHPDLDHATYQRIIEAYYGFHAPLQRRIEDFLGAASVDTERQKIPALLKDLHALGLSAEQIQRLPLCTDLPPLDSHAQLLGIMYVMEGATLGGQVLRRIIADRLQIGPDNGGEFLDVYGRHTGRLWKAFLQELADADQPDGGQATADAACATFACFQAWLERAGVLVP